MPYREKMKAIKAGKAVRPPKKWWTKMQRRINKQYPYRSILARAKITAGIWHKYPKKTKIRIVKKYR